MKRRSGGTIRIVLQDGRVDELIRRDSEGERIYHELSELVSALTARVAALEKDLWQGPLAVTARLADVEGACADTKTKTKAKAKAATKCDFPEGGKP